MMNMHYYTASHEYFVDVTCVCLTGIYMYMYTHVHVSYPKMLGDRRGKTGNGTRRNMDLTCCILTPCFSLERAAGTTGG